MSGIILAKCYSIPLCGADDGGDVVFYLQSYVRFSMPRAAPALPSATRPLAAAQPRHARPTQQPSVSPAKERAPPSSSASGRRRTVPSRGRVVWSPAKRRLMRLHPWDFVCVPLFWLSIYTEGVFFSGDGIWYLPPSDFFCVACVALPTNYFFVSGQIDNWNHLYLSIFPVGHSVILL